MLFFFLKKRTEENKQEQQCPSAIHNSKRNTRKTQEKTQTQEDKKKLNLAQENEFLFLECLVLFSVLLGNLMKPFHQLWKEQLC